MSDIKISQLPQSTQLTGSEIVPMDQVQGGNLVTVKATSQDIANLSALPYTAENVANKSTDGTFNANSDTLYPSQKATKTYVDAVAVGLLRDNGNYDPTTTSQYPTSTNTLSGGNVQKGDIWYISVNGDINGHAVLVGYSVRALVNNAGATTDANWSISNVGLGYVPENVENKSTDVNLGTSDTLYPTQKAVKVYVDTKTQTPTLQEILDENHDLVNNNNFQGADAGNTNSGTQVNGFGFESGYNNSESNINALGSQTAKNNSGADVNALGNQAAKDNSGDNVNALGSNAGLGNTFNNVNLLGANTTANGDFQTVLSGSAGNARIDTSSLTQDIKYSLPNKTEANQTFAMLSDITNTSGWSLTGNSGTDSSINFIGTTDAKDLVLKSNNFAALTLTSTGGNVDAGVRFRVNTAGSTIHAQLDSTSNEGRLILAKPSTLSAVALRCSNLTQTRTLQLPDKDGTLATTSDVGLPYKVYSVLAKYTISGFSIINVFQNTTGASMSIITNSYLQASSPIFTENKTVLMPATYYSSGLTFSINGRRFDDTNFFFQSYRTDTCASSSAFDAPFLFEVRIYP